MHVNNNNNICLKSNIQTSSVDCAPPYVVVYGHNADDIVNTLNIEWVYLQ